MGLRSLSIRLAIENTGTMRQVRRLGAGTEFSELRYYSTSDHLIERYLQLKARSLL